MTAMNCKIRNSVLALSFFSLLLGLGACDGDVQSVHIVTQDYRFAPDMIHVASGRPVHISLFNEGREIHEFDGSFLSDPAVVIHSVTLAGEARQPRHLRIAPGQKLDLRFDVPAGVYIFKCQVRGHVGMTGTLIVE